MKARGKEARKAQRVGRKNRELKVEIKWTSRERTNDRQQELVSERKEQVTGSCNC